MDVAAGCSCQAIQINLNPLCTSLEVCYRLIFGPATLGLPYELFKIHSRNLHHKMV